jgi:glycosyltransferase involved in cell wall biosynthesis
MELGLPTHTKFILFAGRMDQSTELDHPLNHKNSAFAIDVAIENFRTNSDTHMLMAGATTEALPVLQERLRKAGLENRVHFLGIRKDIERLMLASELLFFPSRGEGLGMVAVEAQAAGLRVLASTAVPRECVVIPELVTFMDLTQSTSVWASTISQLIGLERFDGQRANAVVAQSAFSVPCCSDRLAALYARGVL